MFQKLMSGQQTRKYCYIYIRPKTTAEKQVHYLHKDLGSPAFQPSVLQLGQFSSLRVVFCEALHLVTKRSNLAFVSFSDCELGRTVDGLHKFQLLSYFLCLFLRYATEVDVDFVRKSVRAIGRCAIKVEQAAERCVSTLLDLIQTKVNYVVQEAIVVIKVCCHLFFSCPFHFSYQVSLFFDCSLNILFLSPCVHVQVCLTSMLCK